MKSCNLLLCLISLFGSGDCVPDVTSFFTSMWSPASTPLRSFGNGFWNVRVPFKMNMVDIGSHMSVIKLQNGNFLVIDTVEINDQLKRDLDELTQNGTKIEAVLAVHPFHTLSWSAFYKMYPDTKYYGTPRHLRKFTDIKWAGQLDDSSGMLSTWSPEVELRIPAGAEYFNPQPEDTNHFVSIFAYHRDSKTLHVDDTLIYAEDPGWIVRIFFGVKKGDLIFHPAMTSDGLYHTAEAPLQFRDWMKKILQDWDFDNFCAAHLGIKMGNAHAAVQDLVNNSEKVFEDLSERNKKKK